MRLIKPDREPDLILPATTNSCEIGLWFEEEIFGLFREQRRGFCSNVSIVKFIGTRDIEVYHNNKSVTPYKYVEILATHGKADPLHKEIARLYLTARILLEI